MLTVDIDLAERSYTVYVGSGVLGKAHPAFDVAQGSTVLIVSNETVAPLYLDAVARSLAGANVHSLLLPDGETYKTVGHWTQIIDKLIVICFQLLDVFLYIVTQKMGFKLLSG